MFHGPHSNFSECFLFPSPLSASTTRELTSSVSFPCFTKVTFNPLSTINFFPAQSPKYRAPHSSRSFLDQSSENVFFNGGVEQQVLSVSEQSCTLTSSLVPSLPILTTSLVTTTDKHLLPPPKNPPPHFTKTVPDPRRPSVIISCASPATNQHMNTRKISLNMLLLMLLLS